MMNFYYHPILGLQYNYLGETIMFDISSLPYDLDPFEFVKVWREEYNRVGVNFYPNVEIIGQITEEML